MENKEKESQGLMKYEADMKAFRYFDLGQGRGKGDRFLQPWLFCHVYASGSRSRGERKRASRELTRFFKQTPLQTILEEAGSEGEALVEGELMDSAAKYLAICRDDDGFGRKLFGLVRMKQEEKDDKILRDVYQAMLPLLVALKDLKEGPAMVKALDLACRRLYPERQAQMRHLVETGKDGSLGAVLPPFEDPLPEGGGSNSEPGS